MGLDMFLYGIKKDDRFDVPRAGIWKEVCYWRKSNQIHKWFSSRYIKDQDPWGIYEVSPHSLQGLLALCIFLQKLKKNPDDEIIKDKAFELYQTYAQEFQIEDGDFADYIAHVLLPPDNLGCFFGSGYVDEDYWEDIDDTIRMLKEALSEEYDQYYYQASW